MASFSGNFCLASVQTCIGNVIAEAQSLIVAFGLAILYMKAEDKMNWFLLGANFVPQRSRIQGDCFYEQNYSHAYIFTGSAPKFVHFFSQSNYFSDLILTMLAPNSINITTIFS